MHLLKVLFKVTLARMEQKGQRKYTIDSKFKLFY